MDQDAVTISPGPRFRAALLVAILADVLQITLFPFFMEGAESPADDLIDLGVGVVMLRLLGWHWELLPSFVAKLVPGVDLVPFWTLAVASVYRRSRRIAVTTTANREEAGH